MSTEKNAPYVWKGDEKFEVTGQQFELLINTVRAHLSSPEAQKVMLFMQANDALNSIMEEGIKTGKIFQEPIPEQKAPPQSAGEQ